MQATTQRRMTSSASARPEIAVLTLPWALLLLPRRIDQRASSPFLRLERYPRGRRKRLLLEREISGDPEARLCGFIHRVSLVSLIVCLSLCLSFLMLSVLCNPLFSFMFPGVVVWVVLRQGLLGRRG